MVEPVAGSIYGPYGRSNDFVADSYAIGGTEEQFCFDDSWAQDLLGLDKYQLHWFFTRAEKEREICATVNHRQALCHQATDAVWFALVSEETLEDAIKEMEETS